jgi:hypothetical protein
MKRTAMTGALAILWGACMLLVGLMHLWFPAYGREFLNVMSSIYPGFHGARAFGDVIIGTIYGVVDGALAGYIFSSLYRWLGRRGSTQAQFSTSTTLDPTMRRAS